MNEFKSFFLKCKNMLEEIGSSEAKNETELIFTHVLNLSKGKLKLQDSINAKQKRQVLKIVKGRKKSIPLQHLLKNVEFLNLTLNVNKNVLIPRNETEQLADLIIKDIKAMDTQEDKTVLDMCCGSGCLGLAIAKNTKTFATLSDLSKKAIKTAKNNAKINQIDNVEFKTSNLFNKISKKYDIFVSNPPYIKTQEIDKLEIEVKSFEPMLALDGGEDGYKFYKKIIGNLPDYLKDQALVYFEVGINQAQEVKQMLKVAKFKNIEIIKDYYNVERIVKAQFFIN